MEARVDTYFGRYLEPQGYERIEIPVKNPPLLALFLLMSLKSLGTGRPGTFK